MQPLLRQTDGDVNAIKGLEAPPEQLPFHLGYIWGYKD